MKKILMYLIVFVVLFIGNSVYANDEYYTVNTENGFLYYFETKEAPLYSFSYGTLYIDGQKIENVDTAAFCSEKSFFFCL